MAIFSYVARNPQGKTITGTIDALSEQAAAKTLREQGLTPTTVRTGTVGVVTRRKKKGKRGRVRLEDMVVISRQMATMVKAGLPILEGLNILSEQVEKRALKTILGTVEKDVQGGTNLTDSLAKHPKAFDQFFVSMVRAGEASGALDTILEQIAGYLEKVLSIQRKVKSALMYPAAVSTVAVCITTFLLIKVVPVFQDIFAGFDVRLPVPTLIVITVSQFLQTNYIKFIVIIIGLYFAITYWGKTKMGRYRIDSFKLRVPVFGPLLRKVAIAKFTRTLSTLIRCGVNILTALDIVAKTAGNVVIEEAVYKTKFSIQGGESLAKPLAESEVFPPMVTRMIDVGERTGALESMLSKIADFYEDQVDAAVAGLTSLIEPLLIVFLGLVVGFIVISMFLPMFKMVQAIQ